MFFNYECLGYLLIQFYSINQCYDTAIPRSHKTIDASPAHITSILGKDIIVGELPTKGLIISKTKEVHWNNEKLKPEPNFEKYQSDIQNKSFHDGKNQYEIKISSIEESRQDTMTPTDTTGSYFSSTSNVDLSSTPIRNEGIELKSILVY